MFNQLKMEVTMVELYDSKKYPPLAPGDEISLSQAIEKGDCRQVRAFFDREFYARRKVSITWAQLKIAILREDVAMMRLLITWDAQAPEDTAQLNGITKEQYTRYTKILRQAQLPIPAVAPTDQTVTQTDKVIWALPEPLLKDIPPPSEMEVGQMMTVDGDSLRSQRGLFLGVWEPKDRDGQSLGKTFNLYAAPEDLTTAWRGTHFTGTFNKTVKRVAKLRDWYGRDGAEFNNDTELYNALRDGSYKGEWFIPTEDILKEYLYKNKDTGDLRNTFRAAYEPEFSRWHWSCTEYGINNAEVKIVCFPNGRNDKDHRNGHCQPFPKDAADGELPLSCRPVWVEPRP